MQKLYQEAADTLRKTVEEVIIKLRKELADEGLNINQIPKEPMMVEIVSFTLAKCLGDERLVFDPFQNNQQTYQEALEIIKRAVIQYRGNNLVPPSKHQVH